MSFAKIILDLSYNAFFILAGLIGLSLVVAFHEFGHFIFCKIFSVRTPSFSIGFGPRLISKKIGDTVFALSAIPLGGYVEIAGAAEVAQGDQKEAHSRDAHSFAIKPWYQKFLILIAGIIFNMVLTYVIITALFMAGMPKTMLLYPNNATPIVEIVVDNSPAQLAGIKAQDKIISLNGQPIQEDNAKTFFGEIQARPDSATTIGIERDGQQQDISFTTGSRQFLGKTVGTAGIILAVRSLPGYSFIQACKESITLTNKLIKDSVLSLKHIFSHGDTTMVQGPVKIIAATMQGAKEGMKTYLLFLAFISLSLAVMNLLPLPILDGGQIVFYTIEAIIGRPLPERVREYIHMACWLGFVLLVVVLSYRDIKDLISPYWDRIAGFFSK